MDELLVLRVLLFDFVAIFFVRAKMISVEDFVAGPRITYSLNMETKLIGGRKQVLQGSYKQVL